jgi:hypothetical protein
LPPSGTTTSPSSEPDRQDSGHGTSCRQDHRRRTRSCRPPDPTVRTPSSPNHEDQKAVTKTGVLVTASRAATSHLWFGCVALKPTTWSPVSWSP